MLLRSSSVKLLFIYEKYETKFQLILTNCIIYVCINWERKTCLCGQDTDNIVCIQSRSQCVGAVTFLKQCNKNNENS